MATKFVLLELPLEFPDGTEKVLYIDGNNKITAGNGKFGDPRPNAFSLIEIEDCPFSTRTCREVCYVGRLQQAEPVVYQAYEHNSRVIREILKRSDHQLYAEIILSKWIAENCAGGFRWHVSGDIFPHQYAEFIQHVCQGTPEIPFWLYTRSFVFLDPLREVRNLVINLSADQDNYNLALALHKIWGYRLCYLTVDGQVPPSLPRGSVIFPNHELRGRDLPPGERANTPFWQSLNYAQRSMICKADYFGQKDRRRCDPNHCNICLVRPAHEIPDLL